MLLPDGSLKDVVERLLTDAGIPALYQSSRSFRGIIRSDFLSASVTSTVRQMRPWDMGPIVKDGYAHLAIAADDMLWNSDCQDGRDIVVLGHYPLARAGGQQTRLVVAVPEHSEIVNVSDLSDRRLATEYVDGTVRWLSKQPVIGVEVLGCHGKLEVFRDLGVDAILDNVETGTSLKENGWREICEVIVSQTCLFANPVALTDSVLGPVIRSIQLLFDAVIAARSRTMIACNIENGQLEVIERLLQEQIGEAQRPTISQLVGGGHAVQALVPTVSLPGLIIRLHSADATAIVTSPCNHFVK